MVGILWRTSNLSKHSKFWEKRWCGNLHPEHLQKVWLTIWEAIYEIVMDPQLISVHIFRFPLPHGFFFPSDSRRLSQQIYCSMKALGPKAWNTASLCLLTCFIYEAQIKDTDCQGSETALSNNTLCLWQGLFASDWKSRKTECLYFGNLISLKLVPSVCRTFPGWWIFYRVGAVKSVAMPEYTLVIYFLFSLC